MVSRTNVSRYAGAPPEHGDHDRTIAGGPLYSTADVLAALQDKGLVLWTQRSIRKAQELGLDADDVADLLRSALQQGRYKNSEWCQQKPDGLWAASDVYLLTRHEWNDRAFRELPAHYYLKFALAKSGRLVLTVSCHVQN